MSDRSDVARIELEIEATRQRLRVNLEALTCRLQPAALAQSTLNNGLHAANRVGHSLKRRPALLGFAGVAALILAARHLRARK